MLAFDDRFVRLGLEAADKDEAIRKTAGILVELGCVDPGYIDSMLARERQVATYLDNGIAIPHGLREDGKLVRQTAIVAAQFPNGVRWGDGEIVHLAIGIAASSDEHIQILANLTTVLLDAEKSREIVSTTDAAVIVQALTGGSGKAAAVELPAGFDHTIQATVVDASGFHARPATLFAGIAKGFAAEILVAANGKLVNGKSMATLLTLGASKGTVLTMAANGPDGADAVRTLAQAVAAGFDGPEAEAEPTPTPALVKLAFESPALTGVSAAPGIAIGQVFVVRPAQTVVNDQPAGDPKTEEARLKAALAAAHEELRHLHADVAARSGSKQAAIFLAHQELVDDPDLKAAAVADIAKGASAGRAWNTQTENRARDLEALADAMLAERARDLRDIGARVLRLLDGATAPAGLHLPEGPLVLFAEDLAPSDTAGLDPKRVLGLATAQGGPNSHTAILARALGLPAVAGVGAALLDVADGAPAIVDGSGGQVVIGPTAPDLESAAAAAKAFAEANAEARRSAYRPAVTRDGRRLETVANIGSPAEAIKAVEAGAEGVGLLRTEFLFLNRDTAPSEEEQFQALNAMTTALSGLPLVVRTLDIGGDKEVPYLNLAREDNPFLGVRGLRLCLQHPELFEPQLRAIVRAAVAAPEGAVKVMFPMVTSIEEYREGRAALERVRAEFSAPRIECGIMIEVPAAAAMADILAREVEFFSIGTNDLTQYVLAMDRLHPALAAKADALHPAVLRMIDTVVRAAHAAGRWVGVCGNLAAEASACAILVGLGVDELSVSPPAVAELKARVRKITARDARALATRALGCANATEVRALS